MNYVFTVVVGLFSIDMILKTWYVSLYPQVYLDYVDSSKKDNVDNLDLVNDQ